LTLVWFGISTIVYRSIVFPHQLVVMHEDSFSLMQDHKETNSIPLESLVLVIRYFPFFIKETKESNYLESALLFDRFLFRI